MELQDEALLYLRDNITKDEAYYILTTDKEVVAVTFYRYYKKKAKGEVNYRWRTRCHELVDKIVKHRTKVFTGQLIQLAKAYGEKKVIKYQKEEEEVCQDTIETQ